MNDHGSLIYRTDLEARIIFLDANWPQPNSENGTANGDLSEVIGTTIWSHISDSKTIEIFDSVLKAVAEKNVKFTFPFRCDSEDSRRFMELSISYRENEYFEYCSKVLRAEERQFQRLMSLDVRRNEVFLVSCAWCNRFLLPDNQWGEIERVVKELDLFMADTYPQITHGICPRCEAEVLRGLDAIK